MLENRAVRALRRPANWIQLAKFGIVGASGYVVNLVVYAALLKGAGLHYLAAATFSFVVAASWNYWWNRHWTFREQRGHFGYQGMRFFTVSGTVYVANRRRAHAARLARFRGDHLAGGRDRRRHAAELPREQALVVPALKARRRRSSRSPPSRPSPTPRSPRRRPTASPSRRPRRRSRARTCRRGGEGAAERPGGAADPPRRSTRWPPGSRATRRTRPSTRASRTGTWTVNVFSGRAGEIATGTVDDATGAVLTAYTGPQVAWGMARGGPGAFGGTKINSYSVWLGFCAAFLIGLVDWRGSFSLRNLDLADDALVLGLALVLQPRRHLHGDAARLPGHGLAARSAASGSGSATGRRAARRSGRSGC